MEIQPSVALFPTEHLTAVCVTLELLWLVGWLVGVFFLVLMNL